MNRYMLPYHITTAFLLLFFCQLEAQNSFELSAFNVVNNESIRDSNDNILSRGIVVEFLYQPNTTLNDTLHGQIQFLSNKQQVALQPFSFNYAWTDSLQQLVDSVGIDSFANLDTLVRIHIPYRIVQLEEGKHPVVINVSQKNRPISLFRRSYMLQQPKIYDLFVHCTAARFKKDENANPLGLKYYAPDAQWQLLTGVNDLLKGPVNRNKFELRPHRFQSTVADHDAIEILVYDTDPTTNEAMYSYIMSNIKGAFRTTVEKKLQDSSCTFVAFEIEKLERKAVATDFEFEENYVHNGVSGLKINFKYDLPLYFKRKSIRIQLLDEQALPIDDWMQIHKNRKQVANRIKGSYVYFIPNSFLQNIEYLQLWLKANDRNIKTHKTKPLNVRSSIQVVHTDQQEGYTYNGMSGILYSFDFDMQQLPPAEGQLSLQFPALADSLATLLFYWNEATPSFVQKAASIPLEADSSYRLRVFMPYYCAPENIHIAPQLVFNSSFYQDLRLHSFNTSPFQRPYTLNDIQIEAHESNPQVFTGIAGVRFNFKIKIPEYYHSKGYLRVHLQEDGQVFRPTYFINSKRSTDTIFPLYNQQHFTVFIPYRMMQKGKKYTVALQAFNQLTALSEKRSLQHIQKEAISQKNKLYLEKLWLKEGVKAEIKVGLRNNKELNSTYEHLNYKILNTSVVASNSKNQAHYLSNLEIHPDDQISLWVKILGTDKDAELTIRTSISEMQNNQNALSIKEGLFKLLLLKIVEQ